MIWGMENILVEQKDTSHKAGDGQEAWMFEVRVGDEPSATTHNVTVSKEYWEKLTDKQIEPEELVRKSFKFLLAREPKESILGEFELSVIQKYFPEYEKEIKNEEN